MPKYVYYSITTSGLFDQIMAQNKLNTYFSQTYIDVEIEIQYSKYLSDLPWELWKIVK